MRRMKQGSLLHILSTSRFAAPSMILIICNNRFPPAYTHVRPPLQKIPVSIAQAFV